MGKIVKWTEEEINLIKIHYKTMDKKELAKLFPDRDVKGVYGIAHKLGLTKRPSILDRFWDSVNKSSDIFGHDGKYLTECWIWIALKDEDGYGRFSINGKGVKPHRFSYELTYGTIKDNLQIDHLCRRRDCVRPEHLEQVTCLINVRRGTSYNRTKTHCPKGHEYTIENTIISKRNQRSCKICVYQKNKELYHANKNRSKSNE